ncbi:hypothetical protein GCM10023347_43880 [Streptomyces chumphonensis]|uniref:Uncharacterized protein n=2 Tax=Streptomyces chumphonensis TaxID=1214925 RepID=A0A927F0C1_9ACTN|nr:hypothetical protein [Streptomyces chumphonensis]MBD3932798.1 hypothetical protein [Streptomyces chumphonensis]
MELLFGIFLTVFGLAMVAYRKRLVQGSMAGHRTVFGLGGKFTRLYATVIFTASGISLSAFGILIMIGAIEM